MNLADLVDRVNDRDSFVQFVEALASERAEAETMECEEPDRYQLGGALDWQNGEISSFLEAAVRGYFTPGLYRNPEEAPSWKMFAEFLYFGKIYE